MLVLLRPILKIVARDSIIRYNVALAINHFLINRFINIAKWLLLRIVDWQNELVPNWPLLVLDLYFNLSAQLNRIILNTLLLS